MKGWSSGQGLLRFLPFLGRCVVQVDERTTARGVSAFSILQGPVDNSGHVRFLSGAWTVVSRKAGYVAMYG